MSMNKYPSIITLNINGLNAPIKRHRITEWMDKKTWPIHMLTTRDPPQDKRPTQTESEGLEINFPSKWSEKKSRGSNIHIRQNRLQKKGHKERPRRSLYKLKRRIHQEDINIVNVYAPNIGTPKYINKILEDFKKDIDSNTALIGDFNTPLSKMGRSSKQNINKGITTLNNAADQMDWYT